MNTIKYLSISVSIILAFIILLLVIHLFLKPFKVFKDDEENIKKSYGIWFSVLFLTGSGVIYFLMNAIFEAIDVIIRMNQESIGIQILKVIASLFLMGFGWFIICCIIVNKLFARWYKKSDAQSMDRDDTGFFMMKSAMLLGFIFGLSPILEMLLKLVIPQIEIPFYH